MFASAIAQRRRTARLAAAFILLFAPSCAALTEAGLPGLKSADDRQADAENAYDATTAASSIRLINPAARTHVDLSGEWRYLPDPFREGLRAKVSPQYALFRDERDADNPPHRLKEYDFGAAPKIGVPGSWSAQIRELAWYDGLVWHERRFKAEAKPGRRYFLHFGAVNYEATVFLNGERVGAHRGGFTPFDLDVTGTLRPGENSLVVAADSAHTDKTIPPTRTDWWNYGGITRPPLLVEVPETYLADYWLRLGDDGAVLFDARADGPNAAGLALRLRIAALGVDLSLKTDGNGRARAVVPPPANLEKWSPEKPKLYAVEISTGEEKIADKIGFRTIRVVGDDILLNGEPVFLRGVSMHEETVGEIPDRHLGEAGARRLLSEIKEGLNGNFVRLAHYPHAEETLRIADELGLLVWSEIPVYWDVAFDDEEVLAEARAMLRDNILRDRNRASIVIWSVANETPIREDRNRFLTALIDDARALDGTRLVSLASNQNRQKDGVVLVEDPIADKVDLLAVNYYGGWYGGALAGIPNVEWRRGIEKPLVFSEFGAGALASFRDPQTRRMFSVDYQRDYYEATIAMAKKIPFLRGASPWVLKDFKSPRRFHPVYQDYWNRKGLLSPTGERKPAFDTLRAWYDEIEADGGTQRSGN